MVINQLLNGMILQVAGFLDMGASTVVSLSISFGLISIYTFFNLRYIWVVQGEHVGVSENRGTRKWMVYNGKPY